MFVVAQISDLHFNGTAAHRDRIDAVLNYLNVECDGPKTIDALLVTGDLADEGLPAEYREAAETLTSDIPMLTLLGNHDDRAAYTEVTTGTASTAPVNSALRLPGTEAHPGGLLILALDSSIPGRSDGYLSEDTLTWAAEQIDGAAGADVLISFHHPPATIGLPFMDERRLFDTDRLEALIAGHPAVVGVVTGHAHTPAVTTFAGRPLIVAPGVSSTLNLPFEGSAIVNGLQGPGLAFHIIDGHRLTSHFRILCGW